MIAIKIINRFDASMLSRLSIRRGFIIPFPGSSENELMIVDKDFSKNHEAIADNFIYLSSEEIEKNLKTFNAELSEQELENANSFCQKIIKDYREKENEFPTSRKDFLLYEKASIAFDSLPKNGRKFILYRGDGKGYFMPKHTDKIVCSFLMENYKETLIPNNPRQAGPTFY